MRLTLSLVAAMAAAGLTGPVTVRAADLISYPTSTAQQLGVAPAAGALPLFLWLITVHGLRPSDQPITETVENLGQRRHLNPRKLNTVDAK